MDVQEMKLDRFAQLLQFLRELRKAKIAFDLRQSRDDALMVRINVPGERWEVEFLENDEVEVECFRNDGQIHDESKLADLFARFSDAETTSSQELKSDDAVART